MATYLLTYTLPSSNRNEAIKRFVGGDAMQTTAGVKLIGRWHAAASVAV